MVNPNPFFKQQFSRQYGSNFKQLDQLSFGNGYCCVERPRLCERQYLLHPANYSKSTATTSTMMATSMQRGRLKILNPRLLNRFQNNQRRRRSAIVNQSILLYNEAQDRMKTYNPSDPNKRDCNHNNKAGNVFGKDKAIILSMVHLQGCRWILLYFTEEVQG